MPIEQQIVQAAHSALEAGRELGKPNEISHLILLEAKSEDALINIAERLEQKNIRFHLFYEPDHNRGFKSLTTEPITDNEIRRHFSRYSMYRYKAERSFSTKDEVLI
ncbi:MAG TPA: hypothetical protein VFM18_19385 [Methanosarcina sp.]|nr:hypothetical protein [Methanosarcina sp.]